MRREHVAVKDFWNVRGYSLFDNFLYEWVDEDPVFEVFAWNKPKKSVISRIAICWGENVIYYWNGIEYSEKEILKLIKQKAFL